MLTLGNDISTDRPNPETRHTLCPVLIESDTEAWHGYDFNSNGLAYKDFSKFTKKLWVLKKKILERCKT